MSHVQFALLGVSGSAGITSCSTDPGDKQEGQERAASNQHYQGSASFHFLQAGKGVSDLRGMFQAMPTLSRFDLLKPKCCWVSLIFRLDIWCLVGRVGGVLALPNTCCFGLGL